MIHNCDYIKEKFEKFANGQCASMLLVKALNPKICVGDYISINEIVEATEELRADGEKVEISYDHVRTGRSCLVRVSQIDTFSEMPCDVASVRPCRIVELVASPAPIYGMDLVNDE